MGIEKFFPTLNKRLGIAESNYIAELERGLNGFLKERDLDFEVLINQNPQKSI